MSELQSALQYNSPEIESKMETKYNFNQFPLVQTKIEQNGKNEQTFVRSQTGNMPSSDYPLLGKHSRYPVVVSCQSCSQLAMTQIEYENGWANYIWCFLLFPFLATGCCCICLNSCKDVKHKCTKCRADAGTCKSSFI